MRCWSRLWPRPRLRWLSGLLPFSSHGAASAPLNRSSTASSPYGGIGGRSSFLVRGSGWGGGGFFLFLTLGGPLPEEKMKEFTPLDLERGGEGERVDICGGREILKKKK